MKKILFTIIATLFSFATSKANDGVFLVNGNEIMPTTSTSIRIDKEILNIRRISDKQVAVSVYYEFFNPDAAQTLQVGFEALPPQNEALYSNNNQKMQKDAAQPYMHHFTVQMNDSILPYTNRTEFSKTDNYITKYVYLFSGRFKAGKNIVRHSYVCDLSMNISSYYSFYYVLDAAKRWAGGVINDFTLNIDMGSMQAFGINETFFNGQKDWTLAGTGKVIEYTDKNDYETNSFLKCYIRQGCMVYHKLQFHPDKNLNIACLDGVISWGEQISFNAKNFKNEMYDQHIPFTEYKSSPKTKDEFSQRIIRNLPYAHRGYIFKDKALRDYFNTVEWYLPDPNYKP